MKEFINRNKPVFVIALITVAIFVGIIVLSQNAPTVRPTLKKVENIQLIASHTYKKGSNSPKVTLVEFSDFQCPACKGFNPVVNQIVEKYGNDLQLAFRNFPLTQHENAKTAAIAAQAAGAQGKFWEYTDVLYDNQDNLDKENLLKYAEKIGMNVEQFKKDIDDPKYTKQVEDDIEIGYKVGINATPTFILNNNIMDFSTIDDFEAQVVNELKNAGVSETSSIKENPLKQTTEAITQDDKGITPSKDIVIIEYNTGGFYPNNLKLSLGQRVKFINKTDKDMLLRQLIVKYTHISNPYKLEAGKELEVMLTEAELWTFKEENVRHYGSIFVNKE